MATKPSARERARLASAAAQAATEHKPESAPAPQVHVPATARRSPVTGPGQFAAFMGKESSALTENAQLKAKLSEWEGAIPVQELDPALIDESRWANRHDASYEGDAFAGLKSEISSAGGNVQPIKIRPKGDGRYEVIFGHRRLRACKELGLKVRAMIAPVSDHELFVEMDRENREREDLRPYEQGLMYARALKEGLFQSQNHLAREIGANRALVSLAVKIAELPEAVLNAFPSPLDIQYRWAKPLWDMLEKQSERLSDNLTKLEEKKHAGEVGAGAVFSLLTDTSDRAPVSAQPDLIRNSGGVVLAEVSRKGGRVAITFAKGLQLDEPKLEKLRNAIQRLEL